MVVKFQHLPLEWTREFIYLNHLIKQRKRPRSNILENGLDMIKQIVQNQGKC